MGRGKGLAQATQAECGEGVMLPLGHWKALKDEQEFARWRGGKAFVQGAGA